jgi:hypothetical protein
MVAAVVVAVGLQVVLLGTVTAHAVPLACHKRGSATIILGHF